MRLRCLGPTWIPGTSPGMTVNIGGSEPGIPGLHCIRCVSDLFVRVPPVKLVVGLGNPGPRYERTRHNIGFMAVDEITRFHGFRSPREKFNGLICEGESGGERVVVLKPMTFMNNSGESR